MFSSKSQGEPPPLKMNPLWVGENPLSQRSEPPPWRFYQNMRPKTNKRGDTQRVSPLLFRASHGKGLEEAGPAEGWARKCPVDTFLGRGRVHSRQTHSAGMSAACCFVYSLIEHPVQNHFPHSDGIDIFRQGGIIDPIPFATKRRQTLWSKRNLP